jgi:hypothetical protein
MRRGQAAGHAQLFIWGVGPAVVALVGGGLALIWLVAIANRKPGV